MLRHLLHRPRGRVGHWATLGALAGVWGCATTGGPAAVSPAEIPAIEARLSESPSDGPTLHRYAAALLAADRCDEVGGVVARAMEAAPRTYLGPLVLGRCLEQEGRRDEAIDIYSEFLLANGDVEGATAIEAQRRIAVAARAAEAARLALTANQADPTAPPADVNTVAILPALVVGDPRYAALSRGIAAMMISDLDLLERFQLVERIEVEAILDEWALAESERADPETVARLGRVTRAGRAVQGTVTLDAITEAATLEAVVSSETAAAIEVAPGAGTLPSIIDIEKQLVLDLSSAMGYEPSAAERTAILENGTRNLAAFLAFSQGLEASARGDFQAAAVLFEEALQLDPDFQEARTELGSALTVSVMANAALASLPSVGTTADDAMAEAAGVGGASSATVQGSLFGSLLDVGGLDGERTTLSASEPGSEQETGKIGDGAPNSGMDTPPPASGTIRIIFVIP